MRLRTTEGVRSRIGFTLIELLVVIAIIGVLVALIMPAVQSARESANRAKCQNNLKQLGLGLHSAHDALGGFPPAKITTTPTSGWTYAILPYIEQGALYNKIDKTVNWDNATVNDATPNGVNQTDIPLYLCPSAPAGRVSNTRNRKILDYPTINQMDRDKNPIIKQVAPPSDPTFVGILAKDRKRQIVEIRDGSSNTILLAESAGRNQTWIMGRMTSPTGTTGAWANPDTEINFTGFDPVAMTVGGSNATCALNCTNQNEIYAFHPQGANFLFGDGSVRFARSTLTIQTVVALVTRSGGEVVSIDF